jgi:ATPases involved in chromosome partitioning
MPRTIAVVNQIGGSGKTTTAVNLAACLAELGKHVLLIDLDPQADVSYWCSIKDTEHRLLDLFVNDRNLTDLIQTWRVKRVDVIPSSHQLIEAEKALAGKVNAESILRSHLSHLPLEKWDYIFLDCSSSLGYLTLNALTAAHAAIIPVEAHVMALNGIPHLLKLIERVKEQYNSGLKISGILACRVNTNIRHNQEIVELLRKHFGMLVYERFIRENIRLAESPSFGQPITQYDGRSSGAEDYRVLTGEFLRREQQDT